MRFKAQRTIGGQLWELKPFENPENQKKQNIRIECLLKTQRTIAGRLRELMLSENPMNEKNQNIRIKCVLKFREPSRQLWERKLFKAFWSFLKVFENPENQKKYRVILKKLSFRFFRIILVFKEEKEFTIESKEKMLSLSKFSWYLVIIKIIKIRHSKGHISQQNHDLKIIIIQ